MADPFASNEHDFEHLMHEADRLRKQVDTAKAHLNSVAAILAEKQVEYNNGEDELNDLKTRLDRTRTQLVAIIDKRTAHEPAQVPAPSPPAASFAPPLSAPGVPQSVRTRPNRGVTTRGSKEPLIVDDDYYAYLNTDRNIASKTQNGSAIHPSFPTVLYLDGAWTEVHCATCGANASPTTGMFFKGQQGFAAHMQMHMQSRFGSGTKVPMLARLHKRVLTAAEQNALKRGEQPAHKRIEVKFDKNAPYICPAALAREPEGAKLQRFSISGPGQDTNMAGSPFAKYGAEY